MLGGIKGVTLRNKVRSVYIRKKLGVNSIRWYGHMQIMEENNEVRAVGDLRVSGKRPM